MPSPNIWIAASDNDISAIAAFLRTDPTSVNSRDDNGYTPLHAAASYNHLSLLKSLVRTHGGNVNITDDDGDTPLFVSETVETARCIVEDLGGDISHCNNAGLTAADAIEEDGQFPLVAAYLCERSNPVTQIPKPPENVEVNLSTMEDVREDVAPVDMELRRRIEELAARDDFQGEEAQRQLRELVTGAVRDHIVEPEIERSVRPWGTS